ncbi:TPA: fimbrial protein [Klebsiella aerogenes]|nr:fimbrial protein [Klebsiella aerogenes]
MKLTKIGAALILTFCGASAAMAENTITFTGTVLDTGCDIAVDGGTANATVDLGSTAATDLVTKGDLGAPKQFVIDLSSCPTANSANIVFSGQVDADAADPSYFKNSAGVGSAATNVAVQLKQGGSNGTVVENNADNDQIDLSSGAATQTYTASMIATGQAEAGDVQAVLTYNVRYN